MRFKSRWNINNLLALSMIVYFLEVINFLDNFWYLRILFATVNILLVVYFLKEVRWSEIQWKNVFSRTSRTNFLLFFIPSALLSQILLKNYFWEGVITRQILMLSFIIAMIFLLLANRSPFHLKK
jgi:Na+/H+ antiporter NhaD/arsenite permease-like protein